MKSSLKSMMKTVADLRLILEREGRALAAKQFGKLPALAAQKEELTDAVMTLLETRSFEADDRRFVEAFAQLQKKAEDNAAQLAAVRQGFIDAKHRLEALAAAEKKPGFYQSEGRDLRVRAAAAIIRDA